MLDPIVKSLEVACPKQAAFEIFLHEMGSWWPLHRFSASMKRGQPARSLRVEPRLGGTVVEIAHDGAEHLWGTITAYQPYDSFRMDFHIGEPASKASVLEVRFVALAEARTRVELTQRGWEAFGKKAHWMRDGYDKGWAVIFDEAYQAAAQGVRSMGR
jgi:hypothetical protein